MDDTASTMQIMFSKNSLLCMIYPGIFTCPRNPGLWQSRSAQPNHLRNVTFGLQDALNGVLKLHEIVKSNPDEFASTSVQGSLFPVPWFSMAGRFDNECLVLREQYCVVGMRKVLYASSAGLYCTSTLTPDCYRACLKQVLVQSFRTEPGSSAPGSGRHF